MAGNERPAWRVAFDAPVAALPAVEAALADLGGALVTDVPDDRARVSVQLYLTEEPDRARLTALLAAAGLAADVTLPDPCIERLDAADWVAVSETALPALEIGPFYIHGAHVAEPPPKNSVPIQIEASWAFGTGRHESTRGCLLALAELAGTRGVASALDMGCGSGILAIAIAKLWSCPVMAVDSDSTAVELARAHAAANGVGGLVRVKVGEGFQGAGFADGSTFDLIVENILAEPIRALAPNLIRHLAPGGFAVLSGLLTAEEAAVREAHAPLRLARRLALDDWVTIVFEA